jgi:hypothetical protein
VLEHGLTNVLIEANNECDVPRYEHEILQPYRVHERIERAKQTAHGGRRLLVGTSYGGGSIPGERVVAASDFFLVHGNGVEDPDRIAAMAAPWALGTFTRTHQPTGPRHPRLSQVAK